MCDSHVQAQILPVGARKGDEQVGRTLFFDKCNKMVIFFKASLSDGESICSIGAVSCPAFSNNNPDQEVFCPNWQPAACPQPTL